MKKKQVKQAGIKQGTLKFEQVPGAASVNVQIFDDGVIKLLTYYVAPFGWGHELYMGQNYLPYTAAIVGSRSYSKNYMRCNKLPEKYKKAAEWLRVQWEIKWGSEPEFKIMKREPVKDETIGNEIINTII